MTATPWKTNDWFVSEWNYAPEVTKDFKFAKNIKIHDVTLRDGEQQTGIILSKDEKIRIAEALAEAGVHRIEAGMPIVSPSDNAAIKEIVKRNLGPQIFSFARCMKEDVQRAIDTGVNGVVMEIPSSKHMVDLAYRWPMEKAIETSIEATNFAHKNGLEVVFFPIDFSRAELKWALDLIEKVGKEGHMDALALVDTFGVLSPHAMKYFVTQVQTRIPKRLEAHFHQDFGMGVANTIMALSLGVEVMHTTVLGIGERSGNAPMEEIVMALKTMYGVDVGIDCTKLTPLANLVQRLTGVVVPTNKAIVGSGLYQIEFGHHRVVVQELRREERHRAVPDPLVGGRSAAGGGGDGQGQRHQLGQHVAASDVGMQVSEEDAMKVLQAVKLHSLKNKKMLSHAEFRDVARATLGRTQQAAE